MGMSRRNNGPAAGFANAVSANPAIDTAFSGAQHTPGKE
jgi:hypothetical protein